MIVVHCATAKREGIAKKVAKYNEKSGERITVAWAARRSPAARGGCPAARDTMSREHDARVEREPIPNGAARAYTSSVAWRVRCQKQTSMYHR